MKYALHSTIRDGAVDDYRTHHETIPADLVDVFAEAGISDWSIWRSGNRLFHIVESDDLAASLAIVNASDANDRWQAHIGQFVDEFYGADGEVAFAPLETIWTLQDQIGASA